MSFVTEAGEQALEDAVAAIEAVSSAEIVIAIRPRARAWLVQHGLVACVAAIAMLAFTLYSEVEFALWHVLVLPILAGVLGAALVEAIPSLYRFLAPASLRTEHVRDAAAATFVQHGVHATRDRTGLLVYVALRERVVELVGDLGVIERVGIEQLVAWAGALEGALPRGPIALARELATLADPLADALPRRADDIDELANQIQVLGDARRPEPQP